VQGAVPREERLSQLPDVVLGRRVGRPAGRAEGRPLWAEGRWLLWVEAAPTVGTDALHGVSWTRRPVRLVSFGISSVFYRARNPLSLCQPLPPRVAGRYCLLLPPPRTEERTGDGPRAGTSGGHFPRCHNNVDRWRCCFGNVIADVQDGGVDLRFSQVQASAPTAPQRGLCPGPPLVCAKSRRPLVSRSRCYCFLRLPTVTLGRARRRTLTPPDALAPVIGCDRAPLARFSHTPPTGTYRGCSPRPPNGSADSSAAAKAGTSASCRNDATPRQHQVLMDSAPCCSGLRGRWRVGQTPNSSSS
jgi:hypothetical protein